MAHPGLLSWANSVRLTMAGDPGRQAFKDEVQAIGYLFLDDYLDNIVSGAKQGPLIELVKTPGRKKAVSNKPKPGPSKLSSTVLFENQDGENVPLANKFHKTLLSIKVDEANQLQVEKQERTALLPIQPANNKSPASSLSITSLAIPQSLLLPPPSPEHNQLSIIAEDEEPSERAHLSNSVHDIKVMRTPISLPEGPALQCLANFEHSMGNTSRETQERGSAVSDVDTFHSIPLNPFEAKLKDETISEVFDDTEQMVVDIDPGPIEGLGQQVEGVDDNMTSSSHKLPEKHLPPTFPTLPDPVPLRKSIRIRDPSINANMLGAATPGAAATKRTSWLSKAREAKALEGTVKKINIPSIPPMPALNMTLVSAVSLPQGKKRKSGEMLDGTRPTEQEGERIPKIAKISEAEVAPRRSKENASVQIALKKETTAHGDELNDANTSQEGVLNMLKKTVEGLGVRNNKTMGKSLGGNAASILAEAKAAAEARLAARDRKEEGSIPVLNDTAVPAEIVSEDKDDNMAPSTSTRPHGGRLSMSDLFPREGRVKEKHKVPEKVFQKVILPPVPADEVDSNHQRTSTTPPQSPPARSATFVFTKPVPVFVPPGPALSKPASPTIQGAFRPPSPNYLVPSSTILGSHLESSSKGKAPITAQPTLDSLQSETIFDNDNGPAWMPNTQNTDYTAYGSQSQPDQICDEDDSWPVDEKLAAGVQWTYGTSKEDSMTWSTLPSQSQRGGDTGPVTTATSVREDGAVSLHKPTNPDVEMENEKALMSRDTELEEIVLGCKSTVSLVQQPDSTQGQSQLSLASSGSLQSQIGFFGQASKFLSNALGTGKRKPEVKKVLQMAAVAAKKQQEEADKKAARLKEMEIRRQQAIQRKAEEEKTKTMEEERKMKEESERRKKEREEQTEKRPFKPTASKREDDPKKWKIDPAPVDKKSEVKRPAPSVLLGKSHLKNAIKLPAVSSSTSYSNLKQATPSSAMATTESVKTIPIASTPLQQTRSLVPKKPAMDDEFTQPSQLVQSQMAARAKAQIQASKPVVSSESIELPDINSEYSDSEDEDRKRTYDPPHWAQSPELRQALEQQSTINPDNIFGAIRPLKMEEIFKTRTSRFRARTSSANWTGSDRLTVQEELDYARRMGFK